VRILQTDDNIVPELLFTCFVRYDISWTVTYHMWCSRCCTRLPQKYRFCSC